MGVTKMAEARGKLLLLGEHAAVYGHPAVGLSLPWTLKVGFSAAPTWQLPGLGTREAAVRALLERFQDLAAEEGLPRPLPGRLEFTTDIPPESGFGSSGALCAALVDLFFPGLPMADKDRLAWRAEGLFHGTPSGIDTALAFRRGWWALDPSTRPVTARALPDPSLVLVAGSLVRTTDTKTLVGDLARRRAEGEKLVVETLELLGATSARAITLLEEGRSSELPPLINQAREGLRTLGLETPGLSSVLKAGLASPGALAGKLSGAGGGGAFFVVFTHLDAAQAALPRLEAAISPEHWTAPPRVVQTQGE